MPRPRQRAPSGVSLLLELLLGLSLTTMVLLVVFQLFPVADRSVGLADRTTQANYLARTLMENQLSKPYDTLDVGAYSGESKVADHTHRRGSNLSTDFVYRVEVSKPEAGLDIKDVVVEVSWKQGAANLARPSKVRVQSSKGKLW